MKTIKMWSPFFLRSSPRVKMSLRAIDGSIRTHADGYLQLFQPYTLPLCNSFIDIRVILRPSSAALRFSANDVFSIGSIRKFECIEDITRWREDMNFMFEFTRT